MDTASLRADVKRKFRLTVTTFDDDVDECVDMAVSALPPYVKAPVISNVTLSSEDQFYANPTPGSDIRKIYVKNSANGEYELFSDWFLDDDIIYFKDWVFSGAELRIHGRTPFTVATIDTCPITFRRPIVALACAEFATLLAGDKARYNIYSQATGARGVDNMLDMAQYNEDLAERLLLRLGGSEALN